jgi:hypothetical protein
LTSAESRFGRLGCDDLSGRKFFREEIFSGHLWHQCTAERRPPLMLFHRRYIDSQVLKKISAPEHEGADEYS